MIHRPDIEHNSLNLPNFANLSGSIETFTADTISLNCNRAVNTAKIPTNLPTYRPTDLPTYQPTNLQTRVDLDIYLSSKQSYPTNHCANWQAYHPTNQPAYQPTDLPWTRRFHGNNGPFPKQFYSFPGSNYQYTQETCLDVKETCQEVKERCQEVK